MKHFVVAGMIGLSAFSGFGQAANPLPPSPVINRVRHGEQPAVKQPPIVNVQSNEVGRIGQLEEEVRQLNGRIEEMSFQLLQMQEQIRKFQEDNEFRFQDLESGKSGSTTKKSGALETPRTNDQAAVAPQATDGQIADPN